MSFLFSTLSTVGQSTWKCFHFIFISSGCCISALSYLSFKANCESYFIACKHADSERWSKVVWSIETAWSTVTSQHFSFWFKEKAMRWFDNTIPAVTVAAYINVFKLSKAFMIIWLHTRAPIRLHWMTKKATKKRKHIQRERVHPSKVANFILHLPLFGCKTLCPFFFIRSLQYVIKCCFSFY